MTLEERVAALEAQVAIILGGPKMTDLPRKTFTNRNDLLLLYDDNDKIVKTITVYNFNNPVISTVTLTVDASVNVGFQLEMQGTLGKIINIDWGDGSAVENIYYFA